MKSEKLSVGFLLSFLALLLMGGSCLEIFEVLLCYVDLLARVVGAVRHLVAAVHIHMGT